MRRKENAGRPGAGRKIFPGILLGAVCLFSACSGKETVFTAGETAEYGEESPREEFAAGSLKEGAETKYQDGNASGEPDSSGTAGNSRNIEDSGNSDSSTGVQGTGNAEEEKAPLAVYVCGQVNVPGVYELERGARIGDAVTLAGGMKEEAAADALNLARLLEDGQMIRVPSIEEMEEAGEKPVIVSGGKVKEETGTAGEEAAGKGKPGISGSDAGGLISLNQATKEQLMTLPGIGESKAEAILSYRQEQGGFENVEEIMRISGIKEGVYLKIKDKITI